MTQIVVTRQQHITVNNFLQINAYNANEAPQYSVLGLLLFPTYINDLNKAIKFSTAHHFAEDINLVLCGKSLEDINKHINYDLKLLNTWLRVNRISLNPIKIEFILFKWKSQANSFYPPEGKLNGAIGLLSNIRHHTSQHLYSVTHIWFMAAKFTVKSITMNSKNRKITKNNKERNKNNKVSCQQCFYNKKNWKC